MTRHSNNPIMTGHCRLAGDRPVLLNVLLASGMVAAIVAAGGGAAIAQMTTGRFSGGAGSPDPGIRGSPGPGLGSPSTGFGGPGSASGGAGAGGSGAAFGSAPGATTLSPGGGTLGGSGSSVSGLSNSPLDNRSQSVGGSSLFNSPGPTLGGSQPPSNRSCGTLAAGSGCASPGMGR